MKIILDWLTYVAVSCLTILIWVAFFEKDRNLETPPPVGILTGTLTTTNMDPALDNLLKYMFGKNSISTTKVMQFDQTYIVCITQKQWADLAVLHPTNVLPGTLTLRYK